MGALASAANTLKDIPAAAARGAKDDASRIIDIAKFNIGKSLLAPLEGIVPALFATPLVGSFLNQLGSGKKDNKDKPLSEKTGSEIKDDTDQIPEVRVSIAALDEKHFPAAISILDGIKNFAEKILLLLDDDFRRDKEIEVQQNAEADRLAAQDAEAALEGNKKVLPSKKKDVIKKGFNLKKIFGDMMKYIPIILASVGTAIMSGLSTSLALALNPAVIFRAVSKILIRFSPLALIAGALAALAGGITSFLESEKTTFIGKFGDAIGGMIGQVIEFISFGLISKEQIMGILEPLTNIYESVGLFLKDISVDKIIGVFKSAWVGFKDSINKAIDLLPSSEQIMETLTGIADSLGLSDLKNAIMNVIPNIKESALNMFDKIINFFNNLISLIPKSVRSKIGLLTVEEEDAEIRTQIAQAEQQRQDNINTNENRSSVAKGLEKRIIELKERGRPAKEIAAVEQQLKEARVGLGGVTGERLDETPIEQQTFEIAGQTYTGAELKERLASREAAKSIEPSHEKIANTESKAQRLEDAQLQKSISAGMTVVNNNNTITNAPVQQIGGSTSVHNVVQGAFSSGGSSIPSLMG